MRLAAAVALMALACASAQGEDSEFVEVRNDAPVPVDPAAACAIKPGSWHAMTNSTVTREGAAVVSIGVLEVARVFVLGGRTDDGEAVSVRAPTLLPRRPRPRRLTRRRSPRASAAPKCTTST